MPAPASGSYITQEFGVPGNYAAGYHTGRDYAGGNHDIVATRAGKVTRVSYDGDYGNRVEIDTDGIEHSYSHMASVAVSVGQQVSQGQYLGEMGSTGNSTGTHVHYEERTHPYGYYDHRNPQFDKTSGSSGGSGGSGSSYPEPTSGKVYLSKLRYGQYDSDSVWYLQRALNNHPLPGGQTLPTTGNYLSETDEEVRLCQQHDGYGNDPVNASYVGPQQAEHVFAGWGLVIVNDL